MSIYIYMINSRFEWIDDHPMAKQSSFGCGRFIPKGARCHSSVAGEKMMGFPAKLTWNWSEKKDILVVAIHGYPQIS